jgi:hypothetical protein
MEWSDKMIFLPLEASQQCEQIACPALLDIVRQIAPRILVL